MEARVAMDIAQVDGTLEFTLVSSVNLPAEIQRTVDLNDTPFTMKEEHLARMRALSKTGDAQLPSLFNHSTLF
jgi:regulatory protein NPR1